MKYLRLHTTFWTWPHPKITHPISYFAVFLKYLRWRRAKFTGDNFSLKIKAAYQITDGSNRLVAMGTWPKPALRQKFSITSCTFLTTNEPSLSTWNVVIRIAYRPKGVSSGRSTCARITFAFSTFSTLWSLTAQAWQWMQTMWRLKTETTSTCSELVRTNYRQFTPVVFWCNATG